jgi:phosphate transport system protein
MIKSRYEKRLEADLEQIRIGVLKVSEKIETALQDSLHALLNLDKALANQTILGDLPINRNIQENDRLCHSFVARHLPSAGHLRFISSVMRMNVELERIGDYAVTVCREIVQLSDPLDTPVKREAERLAKDTFQMLHQALVAFEEGNAELAKATMAYAVQIDRSFAHAFEQLVEGGQERRRSIRDLFSALIIFNRFERISDQAKNICEEIVFAITGETKQPKVYRVLFLDDGEGVRANLAVAIARKAYPMSGEYVSAEPQPTRALGKAVSQFMEERGLEVANLAPRSIDDMREAFSGFHVIVSLSGPVSNYVSQVPFRTVALEWDVGEPPDASASDEETVERLEQLYRQVVHEVRELMDTLRGEEAS